MVGVILLCVYGFIAVLSAVGFLHPRLRRPEGKAVRQALNSWWPTSLLGGAALLIGPWFAVPLLLVVSLWILREYLRMLPVEGRSLLSDALAYGGVALHYGALVWSGSAGYGPLLFWIFGVMPLAYGVLRGGRGVLVVLPQLQLGVVLSALPLGHVAGLFFLAPSVGPEGGAGLALFLMLLVMMNDGAQYIIGKLFGRRSLAPVLSPKKTWEGFWGGLSTTVLIAALIAEAVTPFGRIFGAALGAGIALLGFLGDLLVSALKRDAGVKDTGAVLPGQGGLLDRCDSFLLSAPVFFWVVSSGLYT